MPKSPQQSIIIEPKMYKNNHTPRPNVAYFEYVRLVHHLNINRLKNNNYNYEILSVDEVFDSKKNV